MGNVKKANDDIEAEKKEMNEMSGVSDRAEPAQVSPMAGRPANDLSQCGLPVSPNPSALRSESCLSRLNTQPALSPVNASPGRLLARTHDLGPIWFAKP